MTFRVAAILLAGGAIAATAFATLAAPPQARQTVTPPKARYSMDITTGSGLAGMGSGAGAAMRMMFGGGGGETRTLELHLGSTLSPTGGAAKADHLPPAALRAGKALPLITPVPGQAQTPERGGGGERDFQRPKARMLIFWGCGEHAPKGQPVVIDFTKIMAGQMPPNLYTVTVPADPGPTAANSRTYGEWPRSRDAKQPGRGSSLLGQHRVVGNYSPAIDFTLTQDWMQALNVSHQPSPGGAVRLGWNGVPSATGYYAWAFGAGGAMQGNQPTDLVWWASSNSREFGGGLTDWLPPATVANLVGRKVVMPASQTQCTIPAEVRAAAPTFMMGSLYAYGPEANFVFPPRPANPREPWKQEWTARARYRSYSMFMIGGPDMGAAMRDAGGDDARPQRPRRCKGVGGILGSVITGQGC